MRTLAVVLFSFLSATAFAQRTAYVVNGLAETLSSIDLQTGTVQNHIVTLGETPNQVVFHQDYLYVVNSISADVMKINYMTLQTEHTFLLPIGSNPYNITIQGEFAYVTGWVSGKVYRLNLNSNTIDGELEIGGFPEGLICYGDYLFVTQTYFDPVNYSYGQGKIAKIDPAGMTLVADYNVGKNPQWISAAPDGRLHIVCTGNYSDVAGSVYLFEPGAGIVTDSILMGGQPSALAVSPLGVGYLSAGGWVSGGEIYSYDIFTGNIINGPSNPIMVGLGASAVASDSLGYIYSCNFGDDTVSKIDFTGQVVNTFNLGDGPLSITILDEAVIGIADEETVAPPGAFSLRGNYPNPFNGGTIIELSADQGFNSGGIVEIYDIAGRLINSLLFETSGGTSEVYWNGNDRDNNNCSSGVYFAAVRSADCPMKDGCRRNLLKMTLIR